MNATVSPLKPLPWIVPHARERRMPPSHSSARPIEPGVRSRTLWPFILIGVAAVVGVILAALPASIVTHFLPPGVRAEDFSGSIWHGSAGRLRVNARDAGALEWR